jgi:hypothetical protein
MLDAGPSIQHPASSSLFQGAAARHERLLKKAVFSFQFSVGLQTSFQFQFTAFTIYRKPKTADPAGFCGRALEMSKRERETRVLT